MNKIKRMELKRLLREIALSLEDAVSEGADGGPVSHINDAYQKTQFAIDLIDKQSSPRLP